MNRQTGIWIDSSKAIIISLDGDKENITEIDSDIENRSHHHDEGNKGTFSGNRHGSSETQFENRIHEQTNRYMDAIIDYVKNRMNCIFLDPQEQKPN